MKPNANHKCSECCGEERFRLLLQDSLSEQIEEEVLAHLETCDACREKLEQFAADRRWWCHATSILQRREGDLIGRASDGILPRDSNIPLPLTDVPYPDSFPSDADESFAADFAVSFLEPSDKPGSLGRLGDFELNEVIGRSAMGIVLKGVQPELNRLVAVKVMAPHLASSGAARKRFARESQAAAAIMHPNVMPIHSVNASGRLPYLVMPYVAGESLQQRLDRDGPLGLADILRIGLQTAEALAAAHTQGLVHRDVKPGNILLEKGVNRVLLADFGLARAVDDASLTRTGVIAGTPQFMSPEQAAGDAIDHRSDLFSLGSVLYSMAAGRPPFRSETTFGVLRRIREIQPRSIGQINPDIPPWLQRLIAKLHAKEPDERFQSAADVAQVMEQCLAHVQQPTVWPLPRLLSEPTTAPLSKFRKSYLKGLIAVFFTLVCGWMGMLAWEKTHQIDDGANQGATTSNAIPKITKEARSNSRSEEQTATESADPSSVPWTEDLNERLRKLREATEELKARTSKSWRGDELPPASSDIHHTNKQESLQ